MNQATADYQRKMSMRSMDTIRVHNPTTEDYIFWNDRFGTNPQKIMVPKAQKDIGYGKGNNDLPRYLAERFTKNMIEMQITKQSDREWVERKKELRMLPKAEMLNLAETEPTRTNDQMSWKHWFPKIWLGVVEKFGGDAIPDPVDPMTPQTGNPMKDTMEELSLADKPYVEEQDTASV